MDIVLVAKKITFNNLEIFERIDNYSYKIGVLRLYKSGPIFQSSDEELRFAVQDRLTNRQTLQEVLAIVRKVHEYFYQTRASEAASEIAAEGAWLRQAEYSPEAYAEMVQDDLNCKS